MNKRDNISMMAAYAGYFSFTDARKQSSYSGKVQYDLVRKLKKQKRK